MIPRDVIPFYYVPSVPVVGWRADLERYVRKYRKPPSDDVAGLWQHMFFPGLALLPVLLDLVRLVPNQDGYGLTTFRSQRPRLLFSMIQSGVL